LRLFAALPQKDGAAERAALLSLKSTKKWRAMPSQFEQGAKVPQNNRLPLAAFSTTCPPDKESLMTRIEAQAVQIEALTAQNALLPELETTDTIRLTQQGQAVSTAA